MKNPVHQYEPHDAPDPMTRTFYVGLAGAVGAVAGAVTLGWLALQALLHAFPA